MNKILNFINDNEKDIDNKICKFRKDFQLPNYA